MQFAKALLRKLDGAVGMNDIAQKLQLLHRFEYRLSQVKSNTKISGNVLNKRNEFFRFVVRVIRYQYNIVHIYPQCILEFRKATCQREKGCRMHAGILEKVKEQVDEAYEVIR